MTVEVSGYFPVRTHTIAQGVAAVVAGLERTDQADHIGDVVVGEPFATRAYGWVRYIGWLPPVARAGRETA
jgi:hypothetical protein